jgi:hypothetical protein
MWRVPQANIQIQPLKKQKQQNRRSFDTWWYLVMECFDTWWIFWYKIDGLLICQTCQVASYSRSNYQTKSDGKTKLNTWWLTFGNRVRITCCPAPSGIYYTTQQAGSATQEIPQNPKLRYFLSTTAQPLAKGDSAVIIVIGCNKTLLD